MRPLVFFVRIPIKHSKDYDNIRDIFRPSHADYTYYSKYGIRDYRGGGRASARITLSRVVAGALAKLVLRQQGISISAYTSQVGDILLEKDYHKYDLNLIESNPVRCPDPIKSKGDGEPNSTGKARRRHHRWRYFLRYQRLSSGLRRT